jgi:hypothetical protein
MSQHTDDPPASGKRIPAYTTGVDVWGYFTSSLYSHPMLSIVLRELFQNARDACRRADRLPHIHVAVLADEDFQYGRVICRDQGCGMQECTLIDRFLCLGGTDKGQGEIGGFGIAKAIILGSSTHWEVRTYPAAAPGLGLYLSLDHLRDRRPVDTFAAGAGRKGTRIVLRYDPLPEHDPRHARLRFRRWHLPQALSWLAHSDTPCTLTARVGQQRAQVWRMDGLQTGADTLVAEGREARTTWRLHQVPALALSDFADLSVGSAGRLFVRLAGLVQFDEPVADHPDAWILDVETEAAPRDPDYPFSLSREEMSGPMRMATDAVLESHRRNPLTSHRRQFRRSDCPTTVYYEGDWLGRGGAASAYNPEPDRIAAAQQIVGAEAVTLRASAFAQAMTVVPNLQRSPLGFAILIKGADRTRRDCLAPHNLRLLAAWAQIVDLVMQANDVREKFGVGFLFDADAFAERLSDDRGVFYLVNPAVVGLSTSKSPETLVKMFVHAGHEVAHSRHADHGEYHSSCQADLLTNAAGVFSAQQRRLARELRGERPSPLLQGLQMSFESMLAEVQR